MGAGDTNGMGGIGVRKQPVFCKFFRIREI